MTKEVFGRPINGDITERYRHHVEQLSPEEFIAALDSVLNDERVESVRWEQYTPYFNDGEPCEFSPGDIRIKLKGVSEDDVVTDYGDGYLSSYDLTDYDIQWDYRTQGSRPFKKELAGVSLEGFGDIFLDLSPWTFWLQETFGDHAEVTATPEGFNVEYYNHD